MAVNAITCRSYARIGLLGNPSDNYYGKTLSVSLANFFAEVCECHNIHGLPSYDIPRP